jgi:hypothetical protein
MDSSNFEPHPSTSNPFQSLSIHVCTVSFYAHTAHVQEVFMNKLLICVKKKQKIELTKEEGWYSETELVELGWSKPGSQLSYIVHLYSHV